MRWFKDLFARKPQAPSPLVLAWRDFNEAQAVYLAADTRQDTRAMHHASKRMRAAKAEVLRLEAQGRASRPAAMEST